MSTANSSQGGLTRRSFLKAAGVTAGAVGLAGAAGMTSADGWLTPAKAHAEPEERVAYAYHQQHCGGHCSLKCTVRDGRLCLIEPNDAFEDPAYRTCCVKALSEVQHVYSAERIQSPMKRVGERGEARFEAISWDEALKIFKAEIEKVWEKYGREAVFVHPSTEASKTLPFLAPILGAQTGGRGGIDMGLGNSLDEACGLSIGTTDQPGECTSAGTGYGRLSNEARDLVNAKYILNVGNNNLETSLVHSSFFLNAQEAGAKIVDVDPHFSTTASKADEWVPIEPGTDAALYLGMTTVVLEKGLYDEDFMLRRTGMPFLVDVTTGRLLTAGEPPVIDKSGKEKPAGDYLVWDQLEGRAVRHDVDGVKPALSGAYVVADAKCKTVFELISESQKSYSLEWASKTTGIPAAKIEEIAVDYATSGASSICVGYGGNDKMSNADMTGHALAILVALTGNIGKPGACVGSYAEGYYGYDASLGSWPLPSTMKSVAPSVAAYDLRYKENGVHAYVACGDAVHQKIANLSETERWLSSLDFVCAIDMCFSTFTDYADLILPVTTKFESEEAYSGIKAVAGHVLLRERVIDPLFESKSDYLLQMEIAELFGVRDALPKSCEEWIRAQLENSKDETIAHITFESLVEHHGVQAQSCQSSYRRAYVDRFGTPSRKMELYFEKMLPYGQALPVYEDCSEVYAKNELRAKYPLQFVQIKSKFRIHNQFYDASWLNQFNQPHVEMNSIDMADRGLASGDYVRIYNDRGHLECSVLQNEAVRPGCVRTYSSIWNKFVRSGGVQYLTNDFMHERCDKLLQGPNIPFNDTLVEVRKA